LECSRAESACLRCDSSLLCSCHNVAWNQWQTRAENLRSIHTAEPRSHEEGISDPEGQPQRRWSIQKNNRPHTIMFYDLFSGKFSRTISFLSLNYIQLRPCRLQVSGARVKIESLSTGLSAQLSIRARGMILVACGYSFTGHLVPLYS